MEGIGDITAVVDALASGTVDAAGSAGGPRAARFDAALSVMSQVERLRSRLEALQIDTLNTLIALADTQLPGGVVPGSVRRHAGDPHTGLAGGGDAPDADGGGDRWLGRAEIVSVELGFELGVSPGAAMSMLHEATRAAETFGASVALLREAGLRPAQFRALTSLTEQLTPQQATRVQDAALRRGTDCSNAVWRARVRRAARRVLGSAALAERRRAGARDRYLRFGEAGVDGMCSVFGLLPALDAAEADAALRWAADTASPGDPRTVDQRRVDALMTILRGPCSFTRPDARAEDAPRLDADLMPLNVDEGEAGRVAGVWAQIRQLAARVNLTIPRVPERLVQITVPAHVLAGADLHTADDGRVGDPGADGSGRTRGGPLLPEARIGALGVIDADLARRLAKDARWQRVVTGPRSGAPLDVGTVTYRPPAAMRRRVLARDRTCRAPGCNRGARLDLDHLVPHRADGSGGATSDINLEGLCRRNHIAKHQLRWRVTLNPDGSITWTRGARSHTTWPTAPTTRSSRRARQLRVPQNSYKAQATGRDGRCPTSGNIRWSCAVGGLYSRLSAAVRRTGSDGGHSVHTTRG